MRFNELTIFNPTIPTWDCVSLRVHRTSQTIPRKDLQKEMNEEFELITVTISLAATAKRKQLSNCHRQTSFQCSHAKHVTSRNSVVYNDCVSSSERASVASNWCVRITKCCRKDIKGHQSSGESRGMVRGVRTPPPPIRPDNCLILKSL